VARAEVKSCIECKAVLPREAVFCSDCGTYQGQDETGVVAGAAMPPPATGTRLCPNCGATNNVISAACISCFRPLTQPDGSTRPFSPGRLPSPSRRLTWTLMILGGVLLASGWAADIIVNVLVHH